MRAIGTPRINLAKVFVVDSYQKNQTIMIMLTTTRMVQVR